MRFPGGRKWLPDTENARALDAGRRFGKMDGQTSLDRFQAHCKWEISVEE
jgi:hypothetical protein